MYQNCQPSSGRARSLDSEPVTLLPDTGEDGLVYSGDDSAAGVPSTLPLNPGEGGPVDSGDDSAAGVPSTLPLNPGEGGPVYPGNGSSGNRPGSGSNRPGSGSNRPSGGSNRPSGGSNRPSGGDNRPSGGSNRPGSGSSSGSSGSSSSGSNSSSNNWGCTNNSCASILPGIISSIVRPNNNTSFGTSRVRFLNAAYNYGSFRISVDNRSLADLLTYASVTGYSQVNAGYRTVTVSGTDGYIYIQKTMPFQANAVTTIAVINTASGMDLLQITDTCCPPTNGYSSFRVGNLAYNSGPLDVLLSDGRVVYADLRFKEVAAFKRIRPGTYQFFYADTNLQPMADYQDIETLDSSWLGVYPTQETFGSLYLDVGSNAIYTVYLLQSGFGRNNIQNLVLTDR